MNKVVSFLTFRKVIGFIGLLLPLAVIVGSGFRPVLPTISHYYHSQSGDIFVGALIICGIFLLCYKGFDKKDDIICNIAGTAVIVTALFPELGDSRQYFMQLVNARTAQAIHFVGAFVTFGSLGYMSFFQFSKSFDVKMNMLHKFLGSIMFICLGAAVVINAIPNNYEIVHNGRILFILETVLLGAFGVSWLIKGKFLRS